MTIARPTTRRRTRRRHRQSRERMPEHCEGCPRCQDPNAPWCAEHHAKFDGRHPRCRACGHCVLRGNHNDPTDDLDRHPGFPRSHGGGMAPISPN